MGGPRNSVVACIRARSPNIAVQRALLVIIVSSVLFSVW